MNAINTLTAAETYAANAPELAGIPSFSEYKEGLEAFLRESAEWLGIDNSRFYSVNRYGYYESCDNAYGGLDVSWAFSKKDALKRAEEEYIRLCEAHRLMTEEEAE